LISVKSELQEIIRTEICQGNNILREELDITYTHDLNNENNECLQDHTQDQPEKWISESTKYIKKKSIKGPGNLNVTTKNRFEVLTNFQDTIDYNFLRSTYGNPKYVNFNNHRQITIPVASDKPRTLDTGTGCV
jgi:hypothetical protein